MGPLCGRKGLSPASRTESTTDSVMTMTRQRGAQPPPQSDVPTALLPRIGLYELVQLMGQPEFKGYSGMTSRSQGVANGREAYTCSTSSRVPRTLVKDFCPLGYARTVTRIRLCGKDGQLSTIMCHAARPAVHPVYGYVGEYCLKCVTKQAVYKFAFTQHDGRLQYV